MKATGQKELRIGNLVMKETGYIFEADFITLRVPHNYFGIPLTEEWLLKFGFAVTDGLFGNKYRKSIDLYTMKDKSIGFVFDDYCITIQYVHQLQNLYFALTGQELEFAKVGE
jgi:hypothetical protein